MADDAIIKIQIDGGGGGSGAGGGGGRPSGGGGVPTPSTPASAGDFVKRNLAQIKVRDRALRLRMAAEKRAQVARDRADRAAQNVQTARDKIMRVAQANQAKVQKQAQAQAAKAAKDARAAQAQANAAAVRTGRLETQERRKREREIMRDNKAKGKLAKVPTTFDSIVDVAEKFRGTIGSAMGTLFGATLDMISSFRHMTKMAVTPSTVIPEAIPLGQPLTALKAPPGSISYATVPTQKAPEATVPPGGDPAGPDQATQGATALEAIPVVGWIVAAGVAAVKVLQAFRDALTGAIKSVGDFATQMINPDTNPANIISMIGKQFEGIGDQLTSFGGLALIAAASGPLAVLTVPAAAALGIFSSSLGAAVGSLAKFTGALDGMVDRYKNYSPVLAQAEAAAEVRQVLGDLRRSREAGPALAPYVNARAELQQKVEDMKVRMLAQLTPLAIMAFDQVGKMLPLIEIGVEALVSMAEDIPWLGDELEAIRARIAREAGEVPDFDPLAAIFEGFLNPGEVRGPGGRRGIMTPDL